MDTHCQVSPAETSGTSTETRNNRAISGGVLYQVVLVRDKHVKAYTFWFSVDVLSCHYETKSIDWSLPCIKALELGWRQSKVSFITKRLLASIHVTRDVYDRRELGLSFSQIELVLGRIGLPWWKFVAIEVRTLEHNDFLCRR